MPKKKQYTISLSSDERSILKKILKRTTSINRRTRCTILLNADESLHGVQLTYQQIATLSGASLGTVFSTIKKFCNDGLDAALTPARHANSDTANLKVTGDIQAKIIAKACSAPPEGRSRWTLSLLEDEMAVILETRISRATIGRVLKNNDLRPHLNDYWCIPPKADAEFVAAMEDNAEEDPNISLTPEAWVESFGAFNSLETPIGRVKMGENQYAKLEEKKRTREFGMVVQTLRNPDVVFIEQSEAKEGQTTERPYSLVFIKTFIRDGEKIRYYSSVTVSKDGMEISVSSHYAKPTKVKEKLTNLRRYYTNEALFSNSSEWRLAEQQDNAVPDLLPTQENNASASEDTTSEEEMQESAQENADKAQEIDAASTAQQAEEQDKEERKQMLGNMSIEELEKEIERIRNFNHPIFTMTEEKRAKK